MVVFDTPNSSHTYTVPADAVEIDVLIRGGPGGDGGPNDSGASGRSGGNAGEVQGTLPVSGGETLPVFVGAAGIKGNQDTASDGADPVSSPVDGGVQSGAGGDGEYASDGGGGSGGTSSAVEHPDGSYLGLGEGGGGGAGAPWNGSSGGGGGGARGGLGGSGGVDTGAGGGGDGGDATGSGSGGDGGDGHDNNNSNLTAGQPGGTVTHADLTGVSTGTSSSGPVVEIVARVPPAAPTVSLETTRATEIDVSWADNADNEDGYRVYTSTDGGSTWTQVADLAANTTSYTVTGLDNGTDYHVKVEAYNDIGTASDTAGPATTVLPDADQPVLGNGVEDEISVDRETAPTNTGSVRWQVRETGESTWDSSAVGFAEGTVSYDTITFPITGREDGERYEVRARTETADVQGSWTTPVAITAQFPTPATPNATADSPTQATVTWDDQADNEDGSVIERRRIWPDGPAPWTELDTLSANTEQFVDDTVQPDAEYEWRITAYTEDAQASATVGETMPSLAGTTSAPVATRGITVEIERSDGTIRRPTPLSDASIRPTLNDRPEVEIPLRPDLSWLDQSWEGADLRVWRDGERIPVDEVAQVQPQPGRTVVIGRGGSHLRRRYKRDVTDEGAHDLLRDALSETGYSYTVDPAPTAENEPIVTIDSQEQLTSAVDNPDTDPVSIDSGGVEPLRTAYMVPANEIQSAKLVSRTDQNWTVSEAIKLDPGENTSWTVDLEHPIPGEHVDFWMRCVADEMAGVVTVTIDGDVIESTGFGNQDGTDPTPADKTVDWLQFFDIGSLQGEIDEMPDLDAGQHTITVSRDSSLADGGGNFNEVGRFYIDVGGPLYDTRYHDPADWTNTLNSSNLLDGPPGPYAAVDVDMLGEATMDRVTGGRIEADLSSTGTEQALGVRGSGPDLSFTTAQNSATVEADFNDDFGRLDVRATLSADDGDVGNNITVYRTQPQRLASLTIKADLLKTATIQDRTIDNRVETILSQVCDEADLIWELQWKDGQQHVVVTRPGQRFSGVDPSLIDWRVSKDIDRQVTEVAVYGSSQPVEGETFVADINNVSLDYDRIQQDSERVYEEHSDGSVTVFERGEDADYTMEYLLGNVRIAGPQSDMVDGQTYQIDYEEQALGEAFAVGTSEQYPVIEELPALHTDLQCERAAEYILRQADQPLWSATVTIPRDEIGFQLSEVIDPSQLPTPADGEGLRVESVTVNGGDLQLELGVGRSLSKIVNSVKRKVSETARQT